MYKLYSNEIVFRGHPDKVCDQISAAILNECLRQDNHTRAGIEVCGGKQKIFITGEITTNAKYNVVEIARRVLNDVGYKGYYDIIDNIGKQSLDISKGVDIGGAGDQGMMFGYACDATDQLLQTAQVILQKFAIEYDTLRQQYPQWLFPDGKAQITGEYDENFNLLKIKTFLVSYQNCEFNREVTDELIRKTAKNICNEYKIKFDEILINPTGKFFVGGFEGDAGLTGRKIVVDAYQSFANVGGGCMNGKDPSKVDISGAYKAREIACRMLKFNNLKWCEVQLSYAIGLARPLAIYIDSNKGNFIPSELLYEECKPNNIIRDLDLLNIDYESQARYGHFTDGYAFKKR